MKPTLLLFDVNETLLDLGTLDPHFERLFGRGSSARHEWFDLLQTLWMTDMLTNQYQPFAKLAEAALQMLTERYSLSAEPEKRTAILSTLKILPAFPDVLPGFQALQTAGFRMAALTNGVHASAEKMLREAGIADFFEQILSIEAVQRFKPAPEAYRYAAEQLNVPAEQICMVAAHGWDLAGARAVGLKTAFVQRPGQVYNPLDPQPDLLVSDVQDLARQLAQSL